MTVLAAAVKDEDGARGAIACRRAGGRLRAGTPPSCLIKLVDQRNRGRLRQSVRTGRCRGCPVRQHTPRVGAMTPPAIPARRRSRTRSRRRRARRTGGWRRTVTARRTTGRSHRPARRAVPRSRRRQRQGRVGQRRGRRHPEDDQRRSTWQDVSPAAVHTGMSSATSRRGSASTPSCWRSAPAELRGSTRPTTAGSRGRFASRTRIPTRSTTAWPSRTSGRGLALSDPVDGYFRLARSGDFGHHWTVQSTKGMPKALDGEFGFAASGTCLVRGPWRNFWFASGGVDTPRIFHSTTADALGRLAAPLRGGPSAGIYSLDFRSSARASWSGVTS